MISAKCSPVSAPPYPPYGVELLGAESLQSPTLTGPPARGSSDMLTRVAHFIRVVQLFSSRVGRIFLDCTRRSLVLVLSLFSSYNVIKLLFSFITLPDVWNSLISRYLLAGCRLHLGFLVKLVLKCSACAVARKVETDCFCRNLSISNDPVVRISRNLANKYFRNHVNDLSQKIWILT